MAFNLRWREVGASALTGTATGIADLFYELVNLLPGTGYEWSVQEEGGPWSPWAAFSTAGAVTYNLQYRDASTQAATTVNGLTDPEYLLQGLTPGAAYEWRVQETDGTNTSAWSAWVAFSTVAEASALRCTVRIQAATCGTGLSGCTGLSETIRVVRGQAVNIEIEVDAAMDLTGAVPWFGISDSQHKAANVVLPVTRSGQVFTASLSGADCAALVQTRHFYACWLDAGQDSIPLARGWISLLPDPRSPVQ